jgi:AcrR family transcriptional regulator
MSDSPDRPPGRPRSDASRAALLDAAYWQVTERGYAAATSEAIAKAAGAGKQTIYRAWPSKARLVLEAFVTKARERIDRPREAAMRAGDVEKFLIADLSALRAFADALRGLFNEAASDAELLAALRSEVVSPRAGALRVTLERAVADEGRREGWIEAIEGAIFRRLMLGEALDESFARRLAALIASGR